MRRRLAELGFDRLCYLVLELGGGVWLGPGRLQPREACCWARADLGRLHRAHQCKAGAGRDDVAYEGEEVHVFHGLARTRLRANHRRGDLDLASGAEAQQRAEEAEDGRMVAVEPWLGADRLSDPDEQRTGLVGGESGRVGRLRSVGASGVVAVVVVGCRLAPRRPRSCIAHLGERGDGDP